MLCQPAGGLTLLLVETLSQPASQCRSIDPRTAAIAKWMIGEEEDVAAVPPREVASEAVGFVIARAD